MEHTSHGRVEPGAGSRPGGRPTPERPVVVVDDDEDTREVLCSLLERAGYRPLAAASGEEAISLMSSLPEPPELAIIDMIMPGMSGADVIHELKQTPELARVPVMVLSGGPGPGERKEPVEVAGWLNKPPSIGELLDLVASLTHRA